VYPTDGAQITNYWRTCCSVALAQDQGNIINNPLFVDRGNNNYRLSKDSPCRNTGMNESWMTNAVDLAGYRRLDRFSGLVDMGCYEYVPSGTMVIIRGHQ
jgi:hypothetical protein